MNYKECINIVSGYIKKNSFSRNLETGIYFSCLNFNFFSKYAELNKKDIEMFNACIDTFIQILLYKSSDSINTVDELYSSCDKLLYVIEDDYIEDEYGGVILMNKDKKIIINNGLKDRLMLTKERHLPSIKKMLFSKE